MSQSLMMLWLKTSQFSGFQESEWIRKHQERAAGSKHLQVIVYDSMMEISNPFQPREQHGEVVFHLFSRFSESWGFPTCPAGSFHLESLLARVANQVSLVRATRSTPSKQKMKSDHFSLFKKTVRQAMNLDSPWDVLSSPAQLALLFGERQVWQQRLRQQSKSLHLVAPWWQMDRRTLESSHLEKIHTTIAASRNKGVWYGRHESFRYCTNMVVIDGLTSPPSSARKCTSVTSLHSCPPKKSSPRPSKGCLLLCFTYPCLWSMISLPLGAFWEGTHAALHAWPATTAGA